MVINGKKTSITINININVECVRMYRLLEVPWIALGLLVFVPRAPFGPLRPVTVTGMAVR